MPFGGECLWDVLHISEMVKHLNIQGKKETNEEGNTNTIPMRYKNA